MRVLCLVCANDNRDADTSCVACGSPLPKGEAALLAGRYEILRPLGRGGMGVVYQAVDHVLDEPVALKLLRRRDGETETSSRRFRSEIKLARRVTHKNVCRIHDYGEDRGLAYISMQYIEGVELRQRIRAGGGLPPNEACAIAGQIADGLQAIHDEGIVHRDLKAANVMIDGHGLARLMDFGIAKATGGEALTATGAIVGTPEDMSPEQFGGDPVDARTDLYALGIILYEMLTGRVPFTADTTIATLMKHLHDEPPLDAAAAGAMPATLVPLLRQALAKKPEDRPSSARDIADALRSAGATEVAAAPPTRPGGAAPHTTRVPLPRRVTRPLVLTGAFAVVGLFAVAALWPVWKASIAEPPRPRASLSAPPAILRTEVTPSPAIAPLPSPTADVPGDCDGMNSSACADLAARYAAGSGVPKDEARAAALYDRACQGGAARGCTGLGVLHNTGGGVAKDLGRAAVLYERGCRGGDASGCNNLGTLYEFGSLGLARDEERAAALYGEACEKGDAQGCGNVAVLRLRRPLTGAAREEAVSLLQGSCAKGSTRACRTLEEIQRPGSRAR
jgi:hypothetical protein